MRDDTTLCAKCGQPESHIHHDGSRWPGRLSASHPYHKFEARPAASEPLAFLARRGLEPRLFATPLVPSEAGGRAEDEIVPANVDELVGELREKAAARLRELDGERGALKARPTEWAYDQACKTLEKHRARADAAESQVATLTAQVAALRGVIRNAAYMIAPPDSNPVAAYEILFAEVYPPETRGAFPDPDSVTAITISAARSTTPQAPASTPQANPVSSAARSPSPVATPEGSDAE